MMYIATVHAYDVLERVQITVSVREQPDSREERIGTVLTIATTVPGVGEDSPREWLRDVLVAALERV
jgi:hypothetical protein